jgi:hypothetical protein
MTTYTEEAEILSNDYDPLNLSYKLGENDFVLDSITLKKTNKPLDDAIGVVDITPEETDLLIQTQEVTDMPVVTTEVEEPVVQESFRPRKSKMMMPIISPCQAYNNRKVFLNEPDLIIQVKHNVYGIMAIFISILIILVAVIIYLKKRKIMKWYHKSILKKDRE